MVFFFNDFSNFALTIPFRKSRRDKIQTNVTENIKKKNTQT